MDERHELPWSVGANFVRVRLVEDGIPRDAHVELDLPAESGATAVLNVRHLEPRTGVPLDFVVTCSQDGVSWAEHARGSGGLVTLT